MKYTAIGFRRIGFTGMKIPFTGMNPRSGIAKPTFVG